MPVDRVVSPEITREYTYKGSRARRRGFSTFEGVPWGGLAAPVCDKIVR